MTCRHAGVCPGRRQGNPLTNPTRPVRSRKKPPRTGSTPASGLSRRFCRSMNCQVDQLSRLVERDRGLGGFHVGGCGAPTA